MSFLRHYHYTARKEHFCDRCCETIWPGQQYERIVETISRKDLIDFKFHEHPMCEYPPEPDWEKDIEESENNRLDEHLKEESFWKEAA